MVKLRIFVLMVVLALLSSCAASGQGRTNTGSEPSGVFEKVTSGADTPEPADNPENEEPPAQQQCVEGIVAACADGSLLLCSVNEFYTLPADLTVYDTAGQETDLSSLRAGQRVEVGFEGNILKIHPAGFENPCWIRILGEGEDLIGLFFTALDAIYQTDEGLNGGIDLLAFDLSGAQVLSDGEKQALIYIFGQAKGLESFSSDYETLCDEGLIDADALYFERGLLITLETGQMKKNAFTFNLEKWRGGLGVYFFYDCQARKSSGEWSYSVGAHMIA